jgi:antitoxin component of MazEF toxin-antitoxin module
MLKKLVKYGNSNALILDRSILALLDIAEGAVVKLRIEGDTLLIKAEKNVKATDILMSEIDSIDEKMSTGASFYNPMIEILKKSAYDLCSKAESNSDSMELLKKWVPGGKNGQKLQEAFGKIMEKYREEIEPLGSQEFQKEFQSLTEKYKKELSSAEYYQEFLALRVKFSPGLAKMDKEMRDASKALGYPEQF